MQNLIRRPIFFLLLMFSFNALADHASLSVTAPTECQDLLAGQTIDVGDVCFEIQGGDTLVVTYTTTGAWTLDETHLWVGDTVDGYPMSKKGNPKVGNFPFHSNDITGSTMYSFIVPLAGITSIDLNDLHSQCGVTDRLYALAHAVVRKADGDSGFITETGWADGDRVVDKGNWATRTTIDIEVTCDDAEPPPPEPGQGQETAIMFGALVFDQPITNFCDDNPIATRWGWQDGPLFESLTPYVNPIYAAAGGNDINNGTHVGNVTIEVVSGEVSIAVELFTGFQAEETHIYIGAVPVCSAAFGNAWVSESVEQLDTSNGVYVGVHFSMLGDCQNNGNFCGE